MQLRSSEIALDGIRQEESLGYRTITSILDAQQEVNRAKIELANVERDLIVNTYTLVAATGRLTMEHLALIDETRSYKPGVYADEVRHRLWGTTITHRDGRRETVLRP